MHPKQVTEIVRAAMKDIDAEYERLCSSWWLRLRRWMKRNF
jgi:hypothetical protein